jgi:hypothetical protein
MDLMCTKKPDPKIASLGADGHSNDVTARDDDDRLLEGRDMRRQS